MRCRDEDVVDDAQNDRTAAAALLLSAACLLLAAPAFEAAGFDLCGCATVPNLQPFDSDNPATFPPGTTDSGNSLTIPLPPDGIFKFSSFTVQNRHVSFAANAANTPVTILVAGDVNIVSTVGCCFSFSLTAAAAAAAAERPPALVDLADLADFAAATARRKASTARPSAAPGLARAVALVEPRRRSRTEAAARFSVCPN